MLTTTDTPDHVSQRVMKVAATFPERYQRLLAETDPDSVVEHGVFCRDITQTWCATCWGSSDSDKRTDITQHAGPHTAADVPVCTERTVRRTVFLPCCAADDGLSVHQNVV